MSDPTPRASLYAKLATIAAEIPAVECDRKHQSMDAWYVSLDKLSAVLNPVLAKHQIAIIPMADAESREPTGKATSSGAAFVQSVNRMYFVIADGSSGESVQCPWVATGTDHQGFDLQKSQTAALRTFLLSLFRIVCVDPQPKQGQNGHPQQPAYQPTKKPTPNATNGTRVSGDDTSITPAQAKAAFFEHFKFSNWREVVKFMAYEGDLALEPSTVNDWRLVSREVAERRKQLQPAATAA